MCLALNSPGGLSDSNYHFHHLPCVDGLGPAGGSAHCSERSDDGTKTQEFINKKAIVPKMAINTLAIIELIKNSNKRKIK